MTSCSSFLSNDDNVDRRVVGVLPAQKLVDNNDSSAQQLIINHKRNRFVPRRVYRYIIYKCVCVVLRTRVGIRRVGIRPCV